MSQWHFCICFTTWQHNVKWKQITRIQKCHNKTQWMEWLLFWIINEPAAAAVAYGFIKGWRLEKSILILIWVEKALATTGSIILWRKTKHNSNSLLESKEILYLHYCLKKNAMINWFMILFCWEASQQTPISGNFFMMSTTAETRTSAQVMPWPMEHLKNLKSAGLAVGDLLCHCWPLRLLGELTASTPQPSPPNTSRSRFFLPILLNQPGVLI